MLDPAATSVWLNVLGEKGFVAGWVMRSLAIDPVAWVRLPRCFFVLMVRAYVCVRARARVCVC